MTCCILGVLIMSLVGRVRRVAGGRSAAGELFAPVAHWPGPGELVPAPLAARSDSRPPRTGALFRYCVLGVALCLVVIPALVWAGVLHNTGSTVMWLMRTGCYLGLIGLAAALSRSGWAPSRSARGAGWALLILGAVIFESGLADMHIFGIIDVEGSVLGDAIFHNIGPLIAVIGTVILSYGAAGRRKTSRRSSRSTDTSACPSSSAVTVSTTPPVTT